MAYTTDTNQDAEQVRLDLLRRMPPSERAALAVRLSADLMAASKAAIRRTHPDYSPRDVNLAFIELHYGSELAESVRAYVSADAHDAAE